MEGASASLALDSRACSSPAPASLEPDSWPPGSAVQSLCPLVLSRLVSYIPLGLLVFSRPWQIHGLLQVSPLPLCGFPRVFQALQSNLKYSLLPRRLVISKRLAQCLHPALPSGVHLKALETYEIVFKIVGTKWLAKDLFLYRYERLPTVFLCCSLDE